MNAVRFLDTNILLYAYDLDAPGKRAMARGIVAQGWTAPDETAISIQVLQELRVNLDKRGVSHSQSVQLVNDYATWTVVESTLSLLQAGLAEQARWKISFWDAMILAAARASGARELITEDFNHGQDYGGIKALNPFR